MGAAVKNRLPDGRQIRALETRVFEDTFNQKQMFGLHKSGLFDPANETIMTVKELDQAIQSGGYHSIENAYNPNKPWRTSEYGFYPIKAGAQLGEKLLYIEGSFSHILKIPDEPVTLPNGETIGLRQAVGMGVIKLEKLELIQIDETTDEVSVTTDFDPKTDVKVVDIMRPSAWALVGADGIPLRSMPSDRDVPEARHSFVRRPAEFEEGSTGYHGSLGRGLHGRAAGSSGRDVFADLLWSDDQAVALVDRSAAEQKIWVAKTLVEAFSAEVEALLRTVEPGALEATRRLLQSLETKE